ncbi:hypothetical protein [Lysinibacillus sp. FJAT-14222]|uniref:hypothetical protein n=1 Tax=Lysinibacillus sp. FJAT-14222 TaxID=1932366 RepID=UPI000AA231D1|nr:hypothetical protein [Lysinibacillus sp. FJAT-14222]
MRPCSGSSDAPGSFALCESEAAAIVLSVAKAKRQLQLFYLCESEATATKRPGGTEINHML